jgi:hypothetical protein
MALTIDSIMLTIGNSFGGQWQMKVGVVTDGIQKKLGYW